MANEPQNPDENDKNVLDDLEARLNEPDEPSDPKAASTQPGSFSTARAVTLAIVSVLLGFFSYTSLLIANSFVLLIFVNVVWLGISAYALFSAGRAYDRSTRQKVLLGITIAAFAISGIFQLTLFPLAVLQVVG